MSLSVNAFNITSFTNNHRKNQNRSTKQTDSINNPISTKGERMKLLTATFIAGLGLGVKLLAELMDGDFLGEILFKKGRNIANKAEKQAKLSKNKKILVGIGSVVGLVGMFIGGFALLYTLYKTPKINYDGKVNAFKKGKEMDTYLKSNKIEKDIYTQMNDKAQNSDFSEKEKLKEHFLKMQMAQNKVPDFVKLKRTN